jgi:hypothetical protein
MSGKPKWPASGNQIQVQVTKPAAMSLALKAMRSERALNDLIKAFANKDQETARLAAWAMAYISDQKPEILNPHKKKILEATLRSGLHPGVRRGGLRVFESGEIPSALEGKVFDFAVRTLEDASETIASRAYAITILAKIFPRYPETGGELKSLLERILPGAGAAISYRGKKLIREINRAAEKG